MNLGRHPAYTSATLGRFPKISGNHRSSTTIGVSTYSSPADIYSSAHSAIIGIPTTSVDFLHNNLSTMRKEQNFAQKSYYDIDLPQNPNNESYVKSNSLPRQRIPFVTSGTLPRSVKWRNDVVEGKILGTPEINQHTLSNVETNFSPINTYCPISWETRLQNSRKCRRTIADIFSAQEYRNWAGIESESDVAFHQNRSRLMNRNGSAIRSTSLPSKAVIANFFNIQADPLNTSLDIPSTSKSPYALYQHYSTNNSKNLSSSNTDYVSATEQADIMGRFHISPLTNRRLLKTVGPGFDVDRLSVNSLCGILAVSVLNKAFINNKIQIIEGKNLKVPDKLHSKQLYVVLEVNEVHRARTSLSSLGEQAFRWDERFEIDVHNATDAQFFIYSWHPQLRYNNIL